MKFHPVLSSLIVYTVMVPVWPSAQAAQNQSSKPAKAPTSVIYRNMQYGFCFLLPESWKGFTIVTEQWQGTVFSSGQTVHGPQLLIRNPKWTQENPYQDIPIMVFTPEEWQQVVKVEMSVSAAPIGPAKLGQNSHYVFALPPRWIGFDDSAGQDEVNSWMEQNRLQTPCGHTSTEPVKTLP